jgi:hypothetical protein
VTEPIGHPYIASFSLDLGDGLVLHRFRASPGGRHLMRLLHVASGQTAEREYGDRDVPIRILEELRARLQAELAVSDTSREPLQPDA